MILYNKKAKDYFNEVVDKNFGKTRIKNLEGQEHVMGGVWKEEDQAGELIWLAFDAKCDFTIEEFDNKEEALKYAEGLQARTRYGDLI